MSQLILDMVLPDIDGVDLLKEVRSNPATMGMPIVVLSTEAEVRDRIRGLETGADDYVGKPYDTGYVVARTRELVRRRAEPAAEPAVVLVIDDSPTFREVLRGAVERAGYRVIMASTGEEGLRIAATQKPAAVIVDSGMPGIDGATVIRKIRLDAALRGTPCLLLTATEGDGAELRALDAGADAFVRKEGDVEIVLARLAAVLRRAQPDPTNVPSLGGPKRILVVDDRSTYREAMASLLRGDGCDVVLARSAEEGLEMLAAQTVDCVLLDVIMPGLGGKEACRRIKATPGLRNIPVIMVTSLEDRAAAIDGLAMGADDFIFKTNDDNVIKAHVGAQLRRKQFEDENRRIREELLRSELQVSAERAARMLAEASGHLTEELERKNQELEASTRAAELTAARLESAVESIQDAIALFDARDRLVLCNGVYRRLIGDAVRGSIVGMQYESLLDAWIGGIAFQSEDERTRYRAERLAFWHRDETSAFDLRMRDGRSLRVVDRRTAEGGVVTTIWDLTDDVRLAEELRRAREMAEAASNAKSEFLSAMSHELRTPLNATLGFAQLLRADKKEPASNRQKEERLDHILKGGKHLLRLIDDILDLARIEARGVSISSEPVSLDDVLGEVRATLEPMAEAHGIRVEKDLLPIGVHSVQVDRTRFIQILMNLGSNAIKYNRPEGLVTFAVSMLTRKLVRVAVRDTGMGIPLERQSDLFKPFHRARQEMGPIEGTGIGLVITKQLARLMDGDVGFQSISGQGSEFWGRQSWGSSSRSSESRT